MGKNLDLKFVSFGTFVSLLSMIKAKEEEKKQRIFKYFYLWINKTNYVLINAFLIMGLQIEKTVWRGVRLS